MGKKMSFAWKLAFAAVQTAAEARVKKQQELEQKRRQDEMAKSFKNGQDAYNTAMNARQVLGLSHSSTGQSVLSSSNQRKTCAKCNGSGKVACIFCDGLGRRFYTVYASVRIDDYERCDDCSATGEMPCRFCDGLGYTI